MQSSELRKKWEPYVGKFFLSFTAIEHTVTITIDLLSEKKISNTARTLLFDKRAELLTELFENCERISELTKARYLNQLKSATSLAKSVRNIIAHNHILMELYKNPNDERIYEKDYIFSSRNRNKKISFEDIVVKSEETEVLAIELSETYLQILDEWWQK